MTSQGPLTPEVLGAEWEGVGVRVTFSVGPDEGRWALFILTFTRKYLCPRELVLITA